MSFPPNPTSKYVNYPFNSWAEVRLCAVNKIFCSLHLFSLHLTKSVTVDESASLTDTGAEVPVLSIASVVVGVAVVAAHRLQLDLLDLHGLCYGCVGSCCRGGCQAWWEEAEETERSQSRYTSAEAEPQRLKKPFLRDLPRWNKSTNKKDFNNNERWIISSTWVDELLRAQNLVFHLLTGDVFTAGYRADEMSLCVCGSTWFLWMFPRLQQSSPLYWCICSLMGTDAVRIKVHDASILYAELRIHNGSVYIKDSSWYNVTPEGSGKRNKRKSINESSVLMRFYYSC